jgi:hypothetical protein
VGPRWVLDSKTEWPTDLRSRQNFDFDCDLGLRRVKQNGVKAPACCVPTFPEWPLWDHCPRMGAGAYPNSRVPNVRVTIPKLTLSVRNYYISACQFTPLTARVMKILIMQLSPLSPLCPVARSLCCFTPQLTPNKGCDCEVYEAPSAASGASTFR